MNLLAAALLLGFHAQAAAAGPPAATVTFQYTNAGLDPSAYTMIIHEDGTGHYQSKPGSAAPPDSMGLDRDVTLGEPLRMQLFAAARHNHLFAAECAAKASHVAYTGDKTFTYVGPEGTGSCTFNYARAAPLQALASSLIAVARTLEEGRRLESLLAHDKLGVDAEIEELGNEQADGRALEMQNIAPVLHAIAADEQVLHRTRMRAQALIDEAAKAR